MRAFRRVIELAPSHVEARLNLARLQQELGRESEALRTLSHVNKDVLDEANASEMVEFQGLVSIKFSIFGKTFDPALVCRTSDFFIKNVCCWRAKKTRQNSFVVLNNY